MAFGMGFAGGYADLAMSMGTLPASLLGLHQDALLHYLKKNFTIVSSEVVSALNEYNGTMSPPREEYRRARRRAFGLPV